MDCPTCGKSLNTEQGMRQHHTKVHGDPLPNRTCKGCGSEFYDPKARKTYCEECNPNAGEHNGNWQDAQDAAECVDCGTEFEYYPSDKDGVYCAACVAEASGLLPENPAESVEKLSIPCKYCGSVLRRYPSAVESSSYGAFCDLNCYGNWLSENVVGESHHQWEGGTINYGAGWWQTRKKALRRDNFRCQNCGRTSEKIGRNPDVHHLTPVREFEKPSDAHTLGNVISLCRRCHRLVEADVIDSPVTSIEK
jgi:5-methylcytosine-specific restriction endonuclease McrA